MVATGGPTPLPCILARATPNAHGGALTGTSCALGDSSGHLGAGPGDFRRRRHYVARVRNFLNWVTTGLESHATLEHHLVSICEHSPLELLMHSDHSGQHDAMVAYWAVLPTPPPNPVDLCCIQPVCVLHDATDRSPNLLIHQKGPHSRVTQDCHDSICVGTGLVSVVAETHTKQSGMTVAQVVLFNLDGHFVARNLAPLDCRAESREVCRVHGCERCDRGSLHSTLVLILVFTALLLLRQDSRSHKKHAGRGRQLGHSGDLCPVDVHPGQTQGVHNSVHNSVQGKARAPKGSVDVREVKGVHVVPSDVHEVSPLLSFFSEFHKELMERYHCILLGLSIPQLLVCEVLVAHRPV